MHCYKYDKDVKVEDCERCITERKCYQWCLDHFVWGIPDGREPLFSNKRRKNFSRRELSTFWMNYGKSTTGRRVYQGC